MRWVEGAKIFFFKEVHGQKVWKPALKMERPGFIASKDICYFIVT